MRSLLLLALLPCSCLAGVDEDERGSSGVDEAPLCVEGSAWCDVDCSSGFCVPAAVRCVGGGLWWDYCNDHDNVCRIRGGVAECANACTDVRPGTSSCIDGSLVRCTADAPRRVESILHCGNLGLRCDPARLECAP